MIKVLITGGGGYIGNILAPSLLQHGCQVTVYDNLIHRQHGILENCANPNFEFVYGDVRDYKSYQEQIDKHDVIINLAAYVGMPLCARMAKNDVIEVNQRSAEFLAQRVSHDQLVIHATTNSGYGLGQHVDGKAVYCTEETPLKPISLYGVTKCAAETAIMTKNNISFRLATVMGISRKMRMDLLVNDFTYRAWNDKFIVLFESSFLRNFIHVRDVTNAMWFAICNSETMRGQVYNLGNTSANVNKMDLCLAIKKYVPDFYITESPINKDPDQRNYIVSNEKLEKLGWKPNFSLDDAIQEVIKACPIIKFTNCPFSDI